MTVKRTVKMTASTTASTTANHAAGADAREVGFQDPERDNPFFTAETSDHEQMARWMLAQQEEESVAR